MRTIKVVSYGFIALRPTTTAAAATATTTTATSSNGDAILSPPPPPPFLILAIQQTSAHHWTLVKGRPSSPAEPPLATATRELLEETGLAPAQVLLDARTFSSRYQFDKTTTTTTGTTNSTTTRVDKECCFFVAVVRDPDAVVLQEEEVENFKWFDARDVDAVLTYEEDRVAVREAVAALKDAGLWK
ncbi:hypothetical protein DFJ73DRAFT_866550 [Zopfochytrium polystomum]|nr:hypothetical protein DFJ73DRAFT_866550 [Zopfochytrium polystomum]